MDTRQLEYVLAIADEEYVSRAAQKLNVSQPALSQTLSKLESELGVPLFSRSRNGLKPTDAGELYISGARRIVDIKKETYEKIEGLTNRGKNRLLIGLSPGRTAKIFSNILPDFKRDFPEVEIQIIEAIDKNLDELMKKGYLDFSILPINHADDQLESEIFVVEEIVLAVNGRHKSAHLAREQAEGKTGRVDIGLFADDKFVMITPGSRLRIVVDSYLKKIGMRPIVLMETSQNSLTCNMVREGLSVGFIPRAYARLYPEIAAISLSPKLTWDLGVTYRKGTRVTDAMRRFFNIAREYAVIEANGALPE
ncbi:MAG: LysR family transcriptional regulator [Treponemataceae bacterium]